ncbi:hypothetical protein VTP21DRAFT_9680 [Calcarisporiella thermophila]
MVASRHCLFRQPQIPIIRIKGSSRTNLNYYCDNYFISRWVNNPTLTEFCFGMIGRADIEGSKSNVAMNAWLPQASYPCGNFSGTSSLKFRGTKGSIGHTFMVCIHTENQNQGDFYPFVLLEISVLDESPLGHLRYCLTDVPPQPNSPPDNVLNLDRPASGLNARRFPLSVPVLSRLFIASRTPLAGQAKARPTAVPAGSAREVAPPGSPARVPGHSDQGPAGPTLRANPYPEVTDLFCRLPLSTLFYQLEAVHLGDLLRAVESAPDPTQVSGSTRHRTLSPDNPIPGWLSLLKRKENSSQGSRRRLRVHLRCRGKKIRVLDRLTLVQLLFTRNLSPLQSSKFSFEYLLLPPRSALGAVSPGLTPKASSLTPTPAYSSGLRIYPDGEVWAARLSAIHFQG